MGFRMILVGLVVGLGLELPSRGDFEAQARSGGAGPVPSAVEAGRAADQAFAAVVEEMVSSFTQDSERRQAPPALAAIAPEDDLYPGLGYALNREAEGLSGSIAPAILAEETAPAPAPEVGPSPLTEEEAAAFEWVTEMAASLPAPEAEEPPAVATEPASGSQVQRLVQAVRLTGAAVHAWVTFLQQAPAVASNHP
jgi:hypothetical protein